MMYKKAIVLTSSMQSIKKNWAKTKKK